LYIKFLLTFIKALPDSKKPKASCDHEKPAMTCKTEENRPMSEKECLNINSDAAFGKS
jgi:hypothetical protein